MADFIFVVENSNKFHQENLQRNPDHYSSLAKWCGSSIITAIQRNFGGKIYYNTMVNIESQYIKYGIIEMEDLKRDLLQWETLYVSGRMQKPISIVIPNPDVETWNQVNLNRAFLYALAKLKAHARPITLYELFHEISSISYSGDIRMGNAEDPSKVDNIVRGNYQEFQHVYKEFMDKYLIPQGDKWIAKNPIQLDAWAQQDLPTLIRSTSMSQTIKGIYSAGITKSIQYLLSKRQAFSK